MESKHDDYVCEGPGGRILIKGGDKVARKLAMLFEGTCWGIPHGEAARRYGYSRQRYYQVRASFEAEGSDGLVDKQRGPHGPSLRTHVVVNQIIRYRFLDPEASVLVITQKLRQLGYKVSQRSVERTITDYGLQKKTSFVKSREGV